MKALLQLGKRSFFVSHELETFDFTGPAPNQSIVSPILYVIVLDLVAADTGQFLSPHGPYINTSICFDSSAHNKFLALGYVKATLIAFEYVPWEFLDLFKVNPSFSTLELEVSDCLLEI